MAKTVIGSSIVVDGEISGEESVVVQGTVKGRISTSESVFVENSAKLEADVEADTVEVGGELTGNVAAGSRVEIKAEGKMIGDVKSPRILIADGALYKGNIDMDVGR
jgi:cytoskeletal protein CcmA (bactofilin family)